MPDSPKVEIERDAPGAVTEGLSPTPGPTLDEDSNGRQPVLARWALVGVLLAIIALFSALEPDIYFTRANLEAVAVTQAVLAILAVATLLPLIIGAFDVSVGANLGLGGVLAAGLAAKQGLPGGAAIVLAIGICTAVGLVNGLLVARGGIDPFIATIAVSTILGGVVLWYTDGQVISAGVPKVILDIGSSQPLGIPLPIWILLVIVVLVWYLTEHTPLGRYLYAVGGSREAARLSGINVTRLTVIAFLISGFLAGVAGVVQAGVIGGGNPTVGPSFLLPAFAAAFLGATAIKLGAFNVWGTIVAVYLLAAGVTGLVQVGVPTYVEPIFNGSALIIGVGLVRVLRSRTEA